MSRKWIRWTAVFAAVLLAAGAGLADRTGEPVAGLRESGMISGDLLNLEKNLCYSAVMTGRNDFVLIGLEGSGMNPHKEGTGLTWISALREYNIMDFMIANELELWNDRIRDPAYESYSTAVVSAVKARYKGVKSAGIFAFSKGACGADAVYRKLLDEGIEVAFVWLSDGFTMHDLPYIKNDVESGELMLYVRFSNNRRLNQVCKEMHKAWKDRENVDSKHISCSHGGLEKYETFTEELSAAIRKASE